MLASAYSRSGAGPRARKQPRQRRSLETVDVILDAATRVFAARGYQRATTNHVADRAGVSIGSLYQYFPDKVALAAALEVRHLDEVAGRLTALARELRRRRVRTSTWVTRFVATLVALNDQPQHVALYAVVPRTSEVQARAEQLVAAIAAELAPLLPKRRATMRATIAIVAAITLVHELVIAAPPAARPALVREVVTMVTAYLSERAPLSQVRSRRGS